MFEKDKLLSKLNIKDYSKELEDILEKKNFSEEAKSILLSMLYKIDSMYKDYERVQRNVLTKDEYFVELFNIIKDSCIAINIINKKDINKKDINKNQKFEINLQDKEIHVVFEEESLLQALYKIKEANIKVKKDNVYDKAVREILKQGLYMSKVDCIKNFSGWTWNTKADDNDTNIGINLLYTNLSMLYGLKFINEILYEIDIFQKIIDKDRNDEQFIKNYLKSCMVIYVNNNDDYDSRILQKIEELKNELEKIKDKKLYMSRYKKENIERTIQMNKLDAILNDIVLLRKEFEERNNKLKESERFFCISDLADKIEEERAELKNIIVKNFKYVDIKNYQNILDSFNEELKLLTDLEVEDDKKIVITSFLINTQKKFLEIITKKIELLKIKKDIMDFVYSYRYYNFLPYKKGKLIYSSKELEKSLDIINRKIIEVLYSNKMINKIVEDDQINFDIIKQIFRTKIVEMEKIHIKVRKNEDKLEVEILDMDMLEHKMEINIKDKKVNIETEKTMKLFI